MSKKNLEMLKTFLQVMKKDEEAINKVIPKMYCEDFYHIDELFLLSEGIKKLIIDIDGTILPADSIDVDSVLIEKILRLKSKNIDMCLVSNNKKERVLPVAEKLEVKYLYEANKPLPIAFTKAMEVLETTNKDEVAMVGDQMLSDIKGANEFGIYSVLVKPISKHQNIQTGTSRFLQNRMEKKLKKIKKFDKDKFYKNPK